MWLWLLGLGCVSGFSILGNLAVAIFRDSGFGRGWLSLALGTVSEVKL
jgi:hypothetical protein